MRIVAQIPTKISISPKKYIFLSWTLFKEDYEEEGEKEKQEEEVAEEEEENHHHHPTRIRKE